MTSSCYRDNSLSRGEWAAFDMLKRMGRTILACDRVAGMLCSEVNNPAYADDIAKIIRYNDQLEHRMQDILDDFPVDTQRRILKFVVRYTEANPLETHEIKQVVSSLTSLSMPSTSC